MRRRAASTTGPTMRTRDSARCAGFFGCSVRAITYMATPTSTISALLRRLGTTTRPSSTRSAHARWTSMLVHESARADFRRARRKAFWRAITSWFRRSDNALLAFDEVRKQLRADAQREGGIRAIPVDHVVGSVGRYRDFDRAVLPRPARTRDRWESVDTAQYTGIELPPIDVYKIGDVYFVKDGNHRVSVARERGQKFVDAHVVEIT